MAHKEPDSSAFAAAPRAEAASTSAPGQEGPQRRYWKATLRSSPLLGFVLLGQWHEQVRIFRWKWLAIAAARRHGLLAGRDLLTESIIEPYRPGENIIPFGAHRKGHEAGHRR